jgi:hypothetical protein
MFEAQHEGEAKCKTDTVLMQNDIETHGELEGGPPAFFTAAEK